MNIVLVPHISEKAIDSAEKGVYVFDVPTSANKVEVAKTVSKSFKVEVVGVNMLIHKGKLKRFQRKLGRQNDTKKAIVRLKKGQTIALFEGSK